MTDNINPSHYKDGPFECIELSRLLNFDWGNVVKYCYRWQSKNGVEDLRKALWYANDAVIHGIPLYADTGLFNQRYVIFCHSLFSALADTDFKRFHRHHIGCDSDTLRAHAVGRIRMHLRP